MRISSRRRRYRIGQERLWGVIAAYLTEQAKRGTVRIAQPRLAAEQFGGILAGHAHARLQLGVDRRMTRREALGNVKLGVRLFLDGCRAPQRA
jgi:TetR/AcrR family transcriptional regulator, mexJK operon transcriptional repressor